MSKRPSSQFNQRATPDVMLVSLQDRLATVEAENDALQQQIADAHLLNETTLEHSDLIEDQLADSAEKLRALSRNLAKYLSPQVYDSIFNSPTDVKISAQRKKLTVFFSDIVGFTATTDHMEPEELTALLNDYLTEMSTIAASYGATVDKYIGDAILAFFGDPHSEGDAGDALACVQMALAMQRRMRELKHLWLARGLLRPFELRIGITTGYCTVGNFGSEDHMCYTIIGGEVNRASRIQSYAKSGSVLMSYETHALVQNDITSIEAETALMKGFRDPMQMFEAIDPELQDTPQFLVHRGAGYRIEVDTLRLTDETKGHLREATRGLAQLLDKEDLN